MKSKLWVKILVPILIIAVIGGIWIVKNATEKTADDSGASQNNAELSDDLKDADFGLRETKAIDFEALSAYGLPIIIDYGADSCIPCKAISQPTEFRRLRVRNRSLSAPLPLRLSCRPPPQQSLYRL